MKELYITNKLCITPDLMLVKADEKLITKSYAKKKYFSISKNHLGKVNKYK